MESHVTAALQSVVQEIRVGALTKHVRNYHGEGTSKFYNWLSDMDQLSNTVDSDRMCVLATMTLGGTAGLYVGRLTNTPITWKDLRQKLRERFGEADNPRLSKEKLRNTKQHKGESVQNYAERLRAAAKDLFDDIDSTDAKDVLVDTFQRGLRDDKLARQIIRKNCKDLDSAEKAALKESQTDKMFHLYRRDGDTEEPMDVDAVHRDEVAELRKKVSELQKQVEETKRTPSRQQHTQNQQQTNTPRFRPPPNTGPQYNRQQAYTPRRHTYNRKTRAHTHHHRRTCTQHLHHNRRHKNRRTDGLPTADQSVVHAREWVTSAGFAAWETKTGLRARTFRTSPPKRWSLRPRFIQEKSPTKPANRTCSGKT